jgi:hypothetical protein
MKTYQEIKLLKKPNRNTVFNRTYRKLVIVYQKELSMLILKYLISNAIHKDRINNHSNNNKPITTVIKI